MLNAVLILTAIAGLCGIGLGMAGRRLAAQYDPMVERIDALLPQTQCGQCGYPGCRPYAEAVANKQAPVNLCVPGGNSTAAAIADLLQVDPQPVEGGDDQGPMVAFIDEQRCIGCTRCLPVCPVDAIIGAPRQMHTVLRDECTGCKLCVSSCPMDCIEMEPVEPPLGSLVRPLPTPQGTRANPLTRPGPLRHPNAEPRPGEVAVKPAKQLSRNGVLESIPLPSEFALPLIDHRGQELDSKYSIGDRLLRGAPVTAAPEAIPLHAPTSGEVIGIEKRAISHPANAQVKCLIISADGEDRAAAPMPALADPLRQPAGALLERIRQAGIRGMGGAAFPSALKLADAAENGVDTLMVNGVECDTYLSCDETLLRQHAAQIVTGARLAARACGASRILIAVKAGSRYAAAAARQAITADGGGIRVVTVDGHYPAGNERNIVYPATGRIVPAGGRPPTVGVVIQNVSTLFSAYRAIVHGLPSLERLLTVSGGAASRPGNYWVRIGTPLRDVLAIAGEPQARIMVGGGIMGIPITTRTIPITHGMSGIILESHDESPLNEQPCIRCGRCTEVCPEGLWPHEMVSSIRTGVNVGEPAESIELDPLRCTGCASCDLVCPSSIPLAGVLGHARDMTRARMAERERAERAKRRNEAKIAREERRKREKEEARQRKRQAVAAQNARSSETTES